MPEAPDTCPLCLGSIADGRVADAERGRAVRINCCNCGDHRFSDTVIAVLPGMALDENARARIAYGVRKVPSDELVTTSLLDSLAGTQKLPNAMERLDNLVLYLASAVAPGERRDLPSESMRAVLGTVTESEAQWVMEEALQLRWVIGREVPIHPAGWELHEATLAIPGWKRHAELMRDGAGSRHAFMAMRFGDAELDQIYNNHIRPAVAQTGFDLRTVSGDHKTAGSIDNRMRVEIRTSRFLICDLTHGNRGAYWEAGFAEGLGRPVFYTCRSNVLADRMHLDHPHFDTAHQLIIPWDRERLSAAMQELKNVIRATLPAEARMEDR
jgi:hypothetical protein